MSMDNRNFQSVYPPYSHLKSQYQVLLYKYNAPELYSLPEQCFQGDCSHDV